ncbi:M15 family metallopeptidase [Arthrobacter sp. E3]|uniref:M15 family metallopeptidase n=1 Tax=Arthrobacter sp. E3 TaxID=517402 RepID=UPI001A94CED5|nr:M15 family metallopeptidase [Arthrobacter sp. E3]
MARLKRELSWPRPGGVAISLAGAALVVTGVLALPSEADSLLPFGAAAPAISQSPTTPDTAVAPASPPLPTGPGTTPLAASQQDAEAPFLLSGAGNSLSPLPEVTATPLIAGSAAGSPLQELFASRTAPPMEKALWDINSPARPLVLVNKRHSLLPQRYVPTDLVVPRVLTGSAEHPLLRSEAAAAAERMFAAAAREGINITIKSSYRSYDTQVSVYNGYVAAKGVAAADSTSARPGFSEHQTGFAMDIGDANAGTACDFASCFASTNAAQWVAVYGARYGFVVRYLPGEESVTGYLAEPWHLRYLGVSVAQDMKVRGIHSYEKYAGLPAAPDYK